MKRGIKLLLRCDADSGYIYDINVYCGKECNIHEIAKSLQAGKRVAKSFPSTITKRCAVLCLGRFLQVYI